MYDMSSTKSANNAVVSIYQSEAPSLLRFLVRLISVNLKVSVHVLCTTFRSICFILYCLSFSSLFGIINLYIQRYLFMPKMNIQTTKLDV